MGSTDQDWDIQAKRKLIFLKGHIVISNQQRGVYDENYSSAPTGTFSMVKRCISLENTWRCNPSLLIPLLLSGLFGVKKPSKVYGKTYFSKTDDYPEDLRFCPSPAPYKHLSPMFSLCKWKGLVGGGEGIPNTG